MVGRIASARDAWQRLYAKRGLQYGGSADVKMLGPYLRKDALVLDAGCGDGKVTEAIARTSDVVGCDFSREALRAIRSQRDIDGQVNLVECNITDMPFESEKFDVVVCVHALSHLTSDERVKASGQLSRVLKKGGHLYVEVFGRGDLRFGEGEEIEAFSFRRGNGIVTHYFQEGEIPSLFRDLVKVAETGHLKRVSYGPVAGKRDLIRVLMRKE